jgi:superfamily II DNA or RNA helicase
MKKPPPKPDEPPKFLNIRGEAVDIAALRRKLLAPPAGEDAPPFLAPGWPLVDPKAGARPGAAKEAPLPELSSAEVERVFDAMCLSGCVRGRTWLVQFLRNLQWQTDRGTDFSPAELGVAVRRLREAGRIVETAGIGFDVPLAQRAQALPRLLAAPAAAEAWRAWARAGASYGHHLPEPPPPSLRSHDERVAFARLVVFGGLGVERFRIVAARVMDESAEWPVLARAVCTPFMPALFERMDPGLREFLLLGFERHFDLGDPLWRELLAWLDAQVQQAAKGVAAPLRYLVAERRLQRGDLPGCEAALDGITGVGVPLLRAAMQAHAGHWPEAAAAFATGLKDATKLTKLKRGIAPAALLEWYALSLLAQPEATAWAQAQKFCVAESGMRQPPPDSGWGLWAHAAAVRLGDAALLPAAFTGLTAQRGLQPPKGAPVLLSATQADLLADRLVLAAWLGHTPGGWSAAVIDAVVRALHERGRPWKADLVRQACERLGLAVPARAEGDPPPWDAGFFGSPSETWRDALAAIEALGGTRGASSATSPAPTYQWRLKLDAEGRPLDVVPYEFTLGPRGPGKPKMATLSKVKKSTRLDPRDAAVARCIDAWRWQPGQLAIDVAGAAIALVGHPGLVFEDAPGVAVDLREALPVLEVRRQPAAGKADGGDGTESFVFELADPLLAKAPPDPGMRFTGTDISTEIERRNGLRIFRDAPDRARLVRISAAQRRVAELVAKKWAVPVAAKAELEAALRVLAGHFQLHSDADAGQAVPSDARLRAQLSPVGDGLQLRLLVQPFGSFGPAVVPGTGRPRLMTLHEGLSLSTERDLALEAQHLQQVQDALPELADSGETHDATWLLEDPEAALAALERLPQLPAVAALDWPRGKPVRVITPATGLQVTVGSGADWFSVDGELRVDESRVLGLQRLMQLAFESKRGRFVALGDGEYLALTERLRQQLADLQAMSQLDKGQLKLPGAAAAFLAETLDGSDTRGDKPWQRRIALLDEAAALQPEPPAALQAQLRSYQAEGYAWMVRLAHAGLGACLADDMGLGKTVQTLALLLNRAALGPALVIAPTSVCGNWAAEAERFAPSLRVQVYGEGDRAAVLSEAGPGDLVVASYALVQIDAEAFAARRWSSLVLDEAQALKNAATKRVKAIAILPADFRLALTGTPVENRLADLWSIMNLLNPGLLGSSGQFNDRFASAIERQRDDGARQRLRRLVSPFLLRRTKAQVLPDLPPRTEIIHRIEPGPEERSFLEALRRTALERVADIAASTAAGAVGQAGFQVLAELTRLRRAACDPRLVAPELGFVGAKVQEFEQLALELVAGRHKALVFSQFTDFLALLGERLRGAGISYQYLDGSTPAAERGKRVAAFQRGEGELFLISLKAGGFGLNLTAADYVLIVDPWWNPAAEDQAMGRAHRIGQQRPVTVYRLVTAGSIEERIVELHRDKRHLADGILEGQDNAAPVRAEDLRALLGAATAE